MKIKKGQYTKKDNSSREIEVLVLEEDNENFEGLDLSKLTDDERKELVDAAKNYDNAIDKVIKKSFRHFKTKQFVSDDTLSE